MQDLTSDVKLLAGGMSIEAWTRSHEKLGAAKTHEVEKQTNEQQPELMRSEESI